jgi:hypothetical protein
VPHISKSQLEELMSCPKLYWYTRYQGVETKDSLGAVLGGSYHKVWEQFFKRKKSTGRNLELDWCLDTFRDEFRARVSEGVGNGTLELEEGEDGQQLDTGVGLVKAYYPYAEQLEPIAVEQKYELSIPGHEWTLYGYIDLAYRSYLVDEQQRPVMGDDGQQLWVPVVVDHKTTGSSPYDEKKPERYGEWARLNQFSHEAIGYALAFRVLFGRQEDRFEYHWAVKLKEPKIMVTPLRFTDVHINWYMDLAVEQVERIKRGFFERNVTSWKHSPRLCPAWDLCHGVVPSNQKKGQIKLV